MGVRSLVACLFHARLRPHTHCWGCERPVFEDGLTFCPRCWADGS